MPKLDLQGTRMRANAGFTLMELMVTLAVAGVLATIAVPNMRTFIQNNRLSGASNDLLRSYEIARSEAIKRQQTVVVCASTDPTSDTPACSYGNFNGWIVFQDTNSNWQWDAGEAVIERHGLLDSNLQVRKDNDGIGSYASSGFANPAGAKTPTQNVVICDKRGISQLAGSSQGRAFLISQTGRVRVSKIYSEVNTAVGKTGSCP